ncbi:MAG: acyltransferase [Cyclobacteriaceae bacterium]|nr:acyltransferase [Cyclobacteriaceae bacterium]
MINFRVVKGSLICNSSILKKTIERIIATLKRDPAYKLDDSYSGRQLFNIVWYRFFQIVRGCFRKLSISTSGIMFCGRRVIIEHGYQVKAGKSLIIEDGVHINALSMNGIRLGDNVTIAKNAVMTCTGVIANKGTGITIGNNSSIGAQSFLGGQGGITIGNDVIMGPQVKIFSENHNFGKGEAIIRKQGESRKGVIIGNNCWIGSGVTILDGVAIGNGCILAAGTIVTRSIPENSIVMGSPGKIVKSRA